MTTIVMEYAIVASMFTRKPLKVVRWRDCEGFYVARLSTDAARERLYSVKNTAFVGGERIVRGIENVRRLIRSVA